MTKPIMAMIPFVLSALFILFSVLQFLQKGIPLNNAYLYASKEKKQRMNKKPYYQQSAIVFFGFGLLFLVIGVGILTNIPQVFHAEFLLVPGILIYTVISSIILKKNRKNETCDDPKSKERPLL